METRIPHPRISPDEQHAQILPFPTAETGESSVDRRQKTRVRLTTRGKTAVAAALLAPAAAVFGPMVTNAVDGPEYSPGTRTVEIGKGEELWGVVEQIDGIEDVNKQDVISHVKEISPDLQDGVDPGDEAVLPRSVTP